VRVAICLRILLILSKNNNLREYHLSIFEDVQIFEGVQISRLSGLCIFVAKSLLM
jgi:hypothetical protein